jgi:hypothetical protein
LPAIARAQRRLATRHAKHSQMREIMYDINSVLIASALFVSMALAIEAGYRLGFRFRASSNDSSKAHVNSIQASLLGILALLLGFTFSLSLQRYDSRSAAVVEEANAIGTAYLRAALLPASVREDVRHGLRDYLALRIRAASVALDRPADREALLAETSASQAALWQQASRAAAEEPNPVTTGLFIQALNGMLDAQGTREAALNRHVPELVLFLLYGTFLLTGGIVGFAAGVANHRPSLVSYVMVGLIVLLVFIIIDLDRPRRGLIEVSQKSLVDLQAMVGSDRDR